MVQVSVVVPTRNRAALLRASVASALRQRGVDLEVVVVDDGCTDDTAGVLAALGDPRVRTVRTPIPGSGPGAARNCGITSARAPWIAFLDDDDLWAPDKLRLQLAAAEESGRRWVYSGSVTISTEDGGIRIVAARTPLPPERLVALLPYRNVIGAGPSNVVAHRDLLVQVGPFDESLPHMEDWDMWIRLAASELPALVPQPLTAYRLHRRHRSMHVAGTMETRRTIEERYRDLREGRPLDWGAAYRYLGWLSLRAGRRRDAFSAYLRSAGHGDAMSLLRAVGALVLPPGVVRRPRRQLLDAGTLAEVERWLHDDSVPPPAPLIPLPEPDPLPGARR